MIVLCRYDLEFKLCQFEWVEVGPVVDVLDEAVDDTCDGLPVVGGSVWVVEGGLGWQPVRPEAHVPVGQDCHDLLAATTLVTASLLSDQQAKSLSTLGLHRRLVLPQLNA